MKQAVLNGKRLSGIVVIIFLLLSLYMIYILITQQGVISANNAIIKEYKQMITHEKETNVNLNQKIESMLSDKNVENCAREKLGLVKPGEKVFIAIGD